MIIEPLPTLNEIKEITQYSPMGTGCFRNVYHKSGSQWVIKMDFEDGRINQREYDNYKRISPSLNNPSLRLPEMHMVGEYLIAEYVEGSKGNFDCWNTEVDYKQDKAYYNKGCGNSACPNGDMCWAELTREISNTVADVHYANVLVTAENTVYVIDLGEH